MEQAVPEFAPERLDVDDPAAIKHSLEVHGYACIKEVASAAELEEVRDLLWEHLEGRETPLMRQSRPVGWKRGAPMHWAGTAICVCFNVLDKGFVSDTQLAARGEGALRHVLMLAGPRRWLGKPETWVEGHDDGLMTSGTHCGAMWRVRSLPGVVKAFETAYGEPVCRPPIRVPGCIRLSPTGAWRIRGNRRHRYPRQRRDSA